MSATHAAMRPGRNPSRLRFFAAAAASGALAGFAGVIWYAYTEGLGPNDGSIPLVKASAEPFKRRQENAGGPPVPNADMRVFDNIGQKPPPPVTEHVLPGPETPLPRPLPEVAAVPAEPARVKLPAQPDLTPLITQILDDKNAPAAGVATKQQLAAVARTVGILSGWRVQLASVRSEAAAQQAWSKAQAAHADLFAGMDGAIVPVQLADRGTTYRLQVGPLRGRDAANALCNSLKARRADCLVVQP